VAENLLELARALEDGVREDDARIGIATEDSDSVEMARGDIPMTASGIIDTAALPNPLSSVLFNKSHCQHPIERLMF
jgi:hypothetical protein